MQVHDQARLGQPITPCPAVAKTTLGSAGLGDDQEAFAGGRERKLGVLGVNELTRGTATRPLQRRRELHGVGRAQWVKSE